MLEFLQTYASVCLLTAALIASFASIIYWTRPSNFYIAGVLVSASITVIFALLLLSNPVVQAHTKTAQRSVTATVDSSAKAQAARLKKNTDAIVSLVQKIRFAGKASKCVYKASKRGVLSRFLPFFAADSYFCIQRAAEKLDQRAAKRSHASKSAPLQQLPSDIEALFDRQPQVRQQASVQNASAPIALRFVHEGSPSNVAAPNGAVRYH